MLIKIAPLLLIITLANATILIIRDLLQFNVAGHPVLHKTTNWDFNPEAGAKRSILYQEENGVRGEKAIERLGLGFDGNQEIRLAQQRERDMGQLGGLRDLS